MMPEEKAQLLALFDHGHRWCQGAEAHDAQGSAVRYNDPSATAWDVTGALCRLFGWGRACELFRQLDRHINGRRVPTGWPVRDPEIDSMAALQDFNDGIDTTFDLVRERIETMPVYHRSLRESGITQRSGNGGRMPT